MVTPANAVEVENGCTIQCILSTPPGLLEGPCCVADSFHM